MVIKVYKKTVYAVERTYVADEQLRKVITKLTKREGITNGDIWALGQLGHKFELVIDPAQKL